MKYFFSTLLVFQILFGHAQELKPIEKIKYSIVEETNLNESLQLIEQELAIHPEKSDLHFYKALIFNINNQTTRAIENINIAIQAESSNATYWYQKALFYLELSNEFEAQKALEEVLLIDSLHEAGARKLALLYEKQQHFSKSIELYLRLVEHYPENYFYTKSIGRIYERLGLLPLALNEYRFALSINDDDDDLIYRLAVLHLNMALAEKNDSIIQTHLKQNDSILNHYLKLRPKSFKLLSARSISYYRQNDFPKALYYLQQIPVNLLDIEDIRQLGITYYYNAKLDSTVKYLEHYLDYNKNNFQAYFFLGIAYRELKLIDESIKCFETGKSILLPDWDVFAQFSSELTDSYLAQKEFKKALLELDENLYYSPDKIFSLYQKAHIYDRYIKDYKNAISFYQLFISKCKQKNMTKTSSIKNYIKIAEQRIQNLEEELFFEDKHLPETKLGKMN